MVRGTTVHVVLHDMPPTAQGRLTLYDPTSAAVQSTSPSGGFALFKDVVASSAGTWTIKDALGAPVTSFKTVIWAGGAVSSDSATATVFADSANFIRDVTSLYGDVAGQQDVGQIVMDGAGSANCASAYFSPIDVPGAASPYSIGVTGWDQHLTPTQVTVRTLMVGGPSFVNLPLGATVRVGTLEGDGTTPANMVAVAVLAAGYQYAADLSGRLASPSTNCQARAIFQVI
ncbi:MAG: hypothetical protein LC624_06985 [Halobacteriales archaeon]|nr:hypothetical protein [Halobacteriales archaeon]